MSLGTTGHLSRFSEKSKIFRYGAFLRKAEDRAPWMMVPFFERRDPGEECRNCLLLPPRLQPDWMPGRLHFDGIEDPVGIFRAGAAPHFVGKIAPRVSFHIQFTAALQLRTEFDVPASIDNRVHIHVTRDVRRDRLQAH